MPRRKWNLNTTYISERLQACLRPISQCALTTVVAPMGYGKTMAISWYLEERSKEEGTLVVRISVYSDNLAIFWKSVQEAFSHAGLDFLQAYPCPTDAAGGSMLADDLCHELAGKGSSYLFIDDFHLLRMLTEQNAFAKRLPDGMLQVIEQDAGILLSSLHPEEVLTMLEECPVPVLKRHPLALLVLKRSMFNWQRIPKMLELKELLLVAIEERPDVPSGHQHSKERRLDLWFAVGVDDVSPGAGRASRGACGNGRVHAPLLQNHRRTRPGSGPLQSG